MAAFRRRAAFPVACASLLACATASPVAAQAPDPADRVKVEPSTGGAYSIRPLTHECRAQPAEGRRERLIALADSMWVRFGRKERAGITEEPNPDAGRDTDSAIAGFWTSIPSDGYTRQQWQAWHDEPAKARQEHWSAAFTSWLMCTAGLSGKQFKRSYRHRDYVSHANEQPKAAAHRLISVAEAPPVPGDLLCARMEGPMIRSAGVLIPVMMHCSLVVRVSGREAEMIGGNVDGSVVKIRASLVGSGANARIDRTKGTDWIFLLKLRDRR